MELIILISAYEIIRKLNGMEAKLLKTNISVKNSKAQNLALYFFII